MLHEREKNFEANILYLFSPWLCIIFGCYVCKYFIPCSIWIAYLFTHTINIVLQIFALQWQDFDMLPKKNWLLLLPMLIILQHFGFFSESIEDGPNCKIKWSWCWVNIQHWLQQTKQHAAQQTSHVQENIRSDQRSLLLAVQLTAQDGQDPRSASTPRPIYSAINKLASMTATTKEDFHIIPLWIFWQWMLPLNFGNKIQKLQCVTQWPCIFDWETKFPYETLSTTCH